MANTIYASFNDSDLAERAAGALLDFGVRPDDLSLVQNQRTASQVITEPVGGQTFVENPPLGTVAEPNERVDYYVDGPQTPVTTTYVKTDPSDDRDDKDDLEAKAKYGISTTTTADAEAGAAKGVAWGAGVGIIAAIASLAVPGFGLILGGGALAIALAGVAASAGAGAIAGGVTGYLKDQGVNDSDAQVYISAVNNGGALLAVTIPSADVLELDARAILVKYGASNINSYSTRGYLA